MIQDRASKHSLIFAHRGASADAPENSLAAFMLARDQGADALELDIRLSADHNIVVIHDPKVDRTTNGKGWVHRMPFSKLRALDAGSWFGSKFAGEKIPTLAEVFEMVGKQLLINIELANYLSPWDDLIDQVVKLVRSCRMEQRVIFSSFFPPNLDQVRQLMPGVPAGLITYGKMAGRLTRLLFADTRITSTTHDSQIRMIHPHYSSVDARFIQKYHAAGQAVNPWTVNDETEIRRLFSLGVDGIITDKPKLAYHIRSSLRSQ